MSTLQYENVSEQQVLSMLYSLKIAGATVAGGARATWQVVQPSPFGEVIAKVYHIGKTVVVHLIDRPAAVSPEFIDSQIKKHLGRA